MLLLPEERRQALRHAITHTAALRTVRRGSQEGRENLIAFERAAAAPS